jgi:ribosomal protein S25
MIVIDGIELGRCVTVRELMQRFGISKTTARKRLRRLERRGLVERRHVGRTVLYCAREGVQVATSPQPLGLVARTRRRMEEAAEVVVREGCVTTATLIQKCGVSHTQAFYVLRLLQWEGRVVETVVGNTALWCRDRATAETFVERLREAVHRLALSNNMRYATPTKILRAVQRDKDAYALFSQVVPLGRADDNFSPAALAFANSLLHALYGEPVARNRRKTVYIVAQPRAPEIAVRDLDKKTITVDIPHDLATALRDADVNEVVLQALEQLLARYRP